MAYMYQVVHKNYYPVYPHSRWAKFNYIVSVFQVHANPLAWSLEQVKLDSDKWKLCKNLF